MLGGDGSGWLGRSVSDAPPRARPGASLFVCPRRLPLRLLISCRSDPRQQGGILGVSQSISSLARILGAAVGAPRLKAHLVMPFLAAAALTWGGLMLVVWASRRGRDFEQYSGLDVLLADSGRVGSPRPVAATLVVLEGIVEYVCGGGDKEAKELVVASCVALERIIRA